MNWNLIWNILSVVLGAWAVNYSTRYPMIALSCAFSSGIIVALSARFDMALVKEVRHGAQK
tara:strand:+ start:569 stop:751 length:183 start_codon:yes stop_codon:yes gene_type:complete